MRHGLISTLVAATLVATSCGGGGQQGEVADLFIELAGEEGIELDRSCVEEAANGLSDSDAEKIAEAGVDGDPGVSAEAEAVAGEMFSCVDTDSYVDSILSQFENDDSIDIDCVRDKLDGIDSVDQVDVVVISSALECST